MTVPEITHEILADYVDRGLVSLSRHNTLPLTIACYTRTTQFSRSWDDVTRNARGLVLHDDGRVIGRGLAKFYAVGDPLAPAIQLDRLHTAFDKADGSLICVTEYEGDLLVWTKGSFNTPHAEAALPFLKGWRPNPGTTTVFEGVFGPLNRVVIDYGEFRGLILLTEVDNVTGKDWAHPLDVAEDTGWAGEVVIERNGPMIQDLVQLCADPEAGQNREGFVIVQPNEDAPATRLKVKFDRYLRLHKIMTGLTARRVHEEYVRCLEASLLADDDSVGEGMWEEFLETIPDEMDAAVQQVILDIEAAALVPIRAAEAAVKVVNIVKDPARKDVAEHFATYPTDVRRLAFLLYDGQRNRALLAAIRHVETDTGMLMQIDDDS